ncbi:MAG: hypothetical protein GY807_05405 [Gammaproteobacteria bacterium]|nr:hypothetical protein [Gammaproteobacteria bacterium]
MKSRLLLEYDDSTGTFKVEASGFDILDPCQIQEAIGELLSNRPAPKPEGETNE